jgi:hypothetical protein
MKFLNRRFAASMLVLPVLLLAACGGSSSSPTPAATVTGLSLTATSTSLVVGATQQLTATATFSDGTTQDVTSSATYLSSAPSKATVSAAGLVTAAAATTTVRITASYSGKTAFKDLTITAVAATLSSIAITPDTVSVEILASVQLGVIGTYSDASTANLTSTATFTVLPTGFASVTSGGLVTGEAVGTAVITASVGGKQATRTVTVVAAAPPPSAEQIVFYDGYGTDVTFKNFNDPAVDNNVTIDSSVANSYRGRKSIAFVITPTTGKFSGGTWVTTTPRTLTGYNAVTFYAKASPAIILEKAGLGDDGGTGNTLAAERGLLHISTSWQKFTLLIPNPAKYTGVNGLFYLADGVTKGATLYLADVVYEQLSTGVLGPVSAAIGNGAQAISLPRYESESLLKGNNSVTRSVLGDPGSPVVMSPVGNAYFDYTSTDSTFASISPAGVITGVLDGGPVTVTAALAGAAASGSYEVTVTFALPRPTTSPPLAAPPTGSNVISLLASQSGGFVGSTVTDKSGNVDTWLTCWSGAGATTGTFAIAAGGTPRKFVMPASGNYVGIDLLGFSAGGNSCGAGTITGANELDLAAMTHFHVDVWTPDDSSNLQFKIQDAGADMIPGAGDAVKIVELLPGSTPPLVTGSWISYDLPLGAGANGFGFTGGGANLHNFGQLVIVAPNGGTIYVDNLYFYGTAGGGGGGGTGPAAVPAPPAPLPANVISLFSSTYAGGAGDYSARVDSYNATCFGPPGNTVADYVIAAGSHTVKQYTMAANSFGIIETIGATGGTPTPPDSAICFGGTQSGANLIDATAMTTIHFDVWSATGSNNFQVQLVNVDAGTLSGPGQGTGSTGGTQFASGANVVPAGAWTGFDIALSSLGPAGAPAGLNKLGLVKFFTTDAGTFYIDNIYFSRPPPPPPVPDFTTITFDGVGATYEFGGFGGANGSLVLDPDVAAPTNHVAKIIKTANAEVWGGVSLGVNGLTGFAAGKIPFSATSKVMTVRVYSPAAGVPVLLKVENSVSGVGAELQVSTTVANAWETLSFNLATVNLAITYDKVSIFPQFGTRPVADETYYFDDITFVP